jgi:hypothetical protein
MHLTRTLSLCIFVITHAHHRRLLACLYGCLNKVSNKKFRINLEIQRKYGYLYWYSASFLRFVYNPQQRFLCIAHE